MIAPRRFRESGSPKRQDDRPSPRRAIPTHSDRLTSATWARSGRVRWRCSCPRSHMPPPRRPIPRHRPSPPARPCPLMRAARTLTTRGATSCSRGARLPSVPAMSETLPRPPTPVPHPALPTVTSEIRTNAGACRGATTCGAVTASATRRAEIAPRSRRDRAEIAPRSRRDRVEIACTVRLADLGTSRA